MDDSDTRRRATLPRSRILAGCVLKLDTLADVWLLGRELASTGTSRWGRMRHDQGGQAWN